MDLTNVIKLSETVECVKKNRIASAKTARPNVYPRKIRPLSQKSDLEFVKEIDRIIKREKAQSSVKEKPKMFEHKRRTL